MEESPKHNQTSHIDLVASSLSGVLVSGGMFHVCLGIQGKTLLKLKCVLIIPTVLYHVEKTWLHAKEKIV